VRGIDLSRGIDSAATATIRAALLEHGVLFFKEQREIPPDVQVQIGRQFGTLHMHPAAPQMPGHPEVFVIHAHKDSKIANGEFWHSDVSCDVEPPLGTILQIHTLPDIGGDTLFANMYAACDALSAPMRNMLAGLTATHESEHIYRGRYSDRGVKDAGKVYPTAVHPIIRTHVDTGRKSLFVNRTFTTRIEGLPEDESKAVLQFLFNHADSPWYQTRFRWRENDVALWDNRCTQHMAIWDYWPNERKGNRVTVKGERPV